MSTDSKVTITSQPQAIAPMGGAAGGNRNVLNLETGADGQRDWSHGLFSCSEDCRLCFRATCCACVVYSTNRQRLEHLQNHGTPLPGGGERCTKYCFTYGFMILHGVDWVLLLANRARVRSRYNIRGSTRENCLTAFCCRPCALVQESREIALEEDSFVELFQSA